MTGKYLLPLLLEARTLNEHLDADSLLIVDLCKPETYAQAHIPGAVFVDYARIIHGVKPVLGLLPDLQRLSDLFSEIGLTADTHVVAYDEEGGGRASRLLWTLEVLGHRRYSLLNGGLHAWVAERCPLSQAVPDITASTYTATVTDDAPLADKAEVLAKLDSDDVRLLDARSEAEYTGTKAFAARGGHIPGAIHFDWMGTFDKDRALRFRPEAELRNELEAADLTPDKEIIVYCQTHHRSAHSYIMLKWLGYKRVKGYAGSWAEWGNASDTPIE